VGRENRSKHHMQKLRDVTRRKPVVSSACNGGGYADGAGMARVTGSNPRTEAQDVQYGRETHADQ
jgi:hypothetical protein